MLNILLNLVAIFCIILIEYYSYKIFKNHSKNWIYVLSLFGYAFAVRILVLIDYVYDIDNFDSMTGASLISIFWIGLTILFGFLYLKMDELRSETK